MDICHKKNPQTLVLWVCGFKVLLFFGLFITDNIIGFSYYGNISSKLEKTREINLILKDSSILSKDEFDKLKLLRSEIINRRTLKDNVYSFFSNISFTSSKNKITTKPIETKPIIKRNNIIHFVTSSLPICLLFIVYFLVGIIDQTETFYYKIFRISSMALYLIPIAFIFSKILYLIPIIDGKPFINYIINTILSILIPYLIILANMSLTSNKRK